MKITRQLRFWLFFAALLIVAASLIFTNRLSKKLSLEERRKMEVWAEAMRQFSNLNSADTDFDFIWQIIENNEAIPVIIADTNDMFIFARNFTNVPNDEAAFYHEQISKLKNKNPVIEIILSDSEKQYVYYDDSSLLKMISYFPYVQLSVIALFLMVSFGAFSSYKKAEQNRVWVGLSKETAHQLGTPISSLLAWEAILKERHADDDIIAEMGKDIARLNTIADRFSKVGSKPILKDENVAHVLTTAVEYMQNRTSQKVIYQINIADPEQTAKINIQLFEWVVENLCKNAVDAIEGSGTIIFDVQKENRHTVSIDISDSGKGIERSKFRTIFDPGYTTKARGWGLGLSLVKRIIEDYHQGKISVRWSEVGKGTTFRILLPV